MSARMWCNLVLIRDCAIYSNNLCCLLFQNFCRIAVMLLCYVLSTSKNHCFAQCTLEKSLSTLKFQHNLLYSRIYLGFSQWVLKLKDFTWDLFLSRSSGYEASAPIETASNLWTIKSEYLCNEKKRCKFIGYVGLPEKGKGAFQGFP